MLITELEEILRSLGIGRAAEPTSTCKNLEGSAMGGGREHSLGRQWQAAGGREGQGGAAQGHCKRKKFPDKVHNQLLNKPLRIWGSTERSQELGVIATLVSGGFATFYQASREMPTSMASLCCTFCPEDYGKDNILEGKASVRSTVLVTSLIAATKSPT